MELEPDAPQGGTEGEATAQPSQVEDATQAPAEDTTAQQTGADEPGQAEEPSDQPKRKPWWEKRFDELTADKYAERRRADALEYELQRLRQPTVQQPEPTAAPPTLDECNWDEAEYQRRTAAFYTEAARKAAREELQSQSAEQRQQTQIQTAATKMQEATARHADFMDVVHDFPLNDAVRDLLLEDPNGAEVLYQVGRDPAEARRIFSLSLTRQAVEFGKIAARLETPEAPSPKPIPPAPPQTVGGVSAGLTKGPEEMSMAEYIAAARQEGRI